VVKFSLFMNNYGSPYEVNHFVPSISQSKPLMPLTYPRSVVHYDGEL